MFILILTGHKLLNMTGSGKVLLAVSWLVVISVDALYAGSLTAVFFKPR